MIIKSCVLMLNVLVRMKTEKRVCLPAPGYLGGGGEVPAKITGQEYFTHMGRSTPAYPTHNYPCLFRGYLRKICAYPYY